MGNQAQAVLDAAMELSVEERSLVADRLLLSLDDEPVTEKQAAAMDVLWAPEIRRRIAEVKSGQVQCLSWEEVDAEMRQLVGEEA